MGNLIATKILSLITSPVGTLAVQGSQSDAGGGDWGDIGAILDSAGWTLDSWANYFVPLVGVIMMVVAVYMIAKGLISHGKPGGGQTNWAVAIILLIVGGAFLIGGFYFVKNVSAGGQKTLNDLATQGKEGGGGGAGSLILYLQSLRAFLPF